MPCGNVWVTNFANDGRGTGYYEYMCWPDDGNDDVDRPPSGGGGGGGAGSGIGAGAGGGGTGGGTTFGPDPSGTGTVVAPGPDPDYDQTLDLNPGWNSGAHSIDIVPPDWRGRISFDVPDINSARPGGVAVGIAGVSDLPNGGRNGYAHLRYGLVFTADTVRVLHGGAPVLSVPYSSIQAARAPDSTTDEVDVLMYGDFIKWVINEETVFAGPFSVTEDYALDATLYLAYDAVDNPVFTEGDWGDIEDGSLNGPITALQMTGDMYGESSLTGSIGPIAMQLSEGATCSIQGFIGPLQMTAGGGVSAPGTGGVTGQIGPLVVVAADTNDYTYVAGSIGPLSAWIGMGEPDPSVKYSVLAPRLPRMTMTATCPAIGALNASTPGLYMRASAESHYSEIIAPLPGMRFLAYGGEMTPLVQVMEYLGNKTTVAPQAYIGVAIIEQLGGTATAIAYATTAVDISESIEGRDATSYFATLFASIAEQLAVGDRMTVAVLDMTSGRLDAPGEAWVVNTESSASTRYDTYGFNSFARIGGKHYGARQDGVYLLEGASDAGAPITSGVSFGKQDFGTQALKHMDAVYAGVSSTGTLFLKVGDGKNSYTYKARRKDDHMRVQRFDVGRGLRANYFDLQLTSTADAFELDSVTFHVLPSSRRI